MTHYPVPDLFLVNALKGHDAFFSRMIEMIPNELYKHSLSEDVDNDNTKYYKHRKLPLTVDEKKVLSKQKKTDKYSAPIKKMSKESEDESTDEDSEGEEFNPIASVSAHDVLDMSTSSCNDLDTLRQRLQQRISGMKSDRLTKKPHKLQAQAAIASKERASKLDKKKHNKKRKKSDEVVESVAEVVNKSQKTLEKSSSSIRNDESGPVATDIEFNKMLMIGSTGAPSGVDKNKGKPGSKVQRLNRLLEEAKFKREKLSQMSKSDDPVQLQSLQSVKWSDALKSATGDKSLLVSGSGSGLDAEAKIKKAIKRREKAKQKSAAEWKERLDAVEESKTARITKREDNLLAKKNSKAGIVVEDQTKDKPETLKRSSTSGINNGGNAATSKVGKGEKSRAGFEGKKKAGDFLNKGHSGGAHKQKK